MVGVAVALAIALVWSLFAVRIGPRIGFVDLPGSSALKVHDRPIPLLGGVGVFAGVHAGLAIEDVFDPALFVASSLVLGLGLVDDAIGLSPRVRLGAELIAALVLSAFVESGLNTPLGFLFSTVFVVVAINAVNLLDGLDGLVGGVTVIAAVALALAGLVGLGATALGFVLAAATAGFLVFNWYPARLFLGDNGAYTLGVMLAYGIIRTSDSGIVTMLLVAVGAMGVFFIDLVGTVLRRKVEARPLFSGDRSHIYDQLRDRGWSVPAVSATAALVQASLGAVFIALALADLPPIVGIAAIASGGIVVLVMLWRLRFITQPSQ